MASDTKTTEQPAHAEDEGRVWRPSLRPEHGAGLAAGGERNPIVEQSEQVGPLGFVLNYLKRPFVKLVIGLGIFIFAAIVYDATVNFGDWTEKAEKPEASKHRGVAKAPQ